MEKWDGKSEARIPIITIATEPGSGGSIIAQKIAERLALDLFEDEIIQEIADSAGTSTEKIEALEKQRLSGIQDFISSLISDRYLWPGLYLTHLKKVVDVIGKHGQAVIVGRGANFLLPPEKRLSVRVMAPLETRVQNVVRTFGAPYEEAKRRILNREARRKAFVRNSFNADIADYENYDLIVNTGGLSIEAAVGAVIGALVDKT